MSAPPSAGPSDAASVLRPPKRPAANPWRSRGKAAISSVSDVGITPAAPVAWKTRKKITQDTVGESAAPTDAAANRHRPPRKTVLWPRRSARRPIVRKSTVSTRL